MRPLIPRHPFAWPLSHRHVPQHGPTPSKRRALLWLTLLLPLIATPLLTRSYTLGLNASPSLPHTLYLIHKGAKLERGQYVAFRWHGGGPYAAHTPFIKILTGLPGDTVTALDREFQVNQVPVGRAKQASRTGTPLEPGPTGIIPAGQYYVSAPHPDSLDSRYRLTGWIRQSQIIGRAHVLF